MNMRQKQIHYKREGLLIYKIHCHIQITTFEGKNNE